MIRMTTQEKALRYDLDTATGKLKIAVGWIGSRHNSGKEFNDEELLEIRDLCEGPLRGAVEDLRRAVDEVLVYRGSVKKEPVELSDKNGQMKVEGLRCLRCGWEWRPRSDQEPAECPRCKSRLWNRERLNAEV